ncbi:MAG: sensor histidine kinase [Treponemataceae bacterium]
MKHVKVALDRLEAFFEPRLPQYLEDKYRQQLLRVDIVQFKIFAIVVLIGLGAFIRSDYLANGFGPVFVALVVGKAVFAISTIVLLFSLKRVVRYRSFDRIVFVWTIVYSILVIVIDLSRPPAYTGRFLANLLNIIGFYILIPNTVLLRTASASIFTVLVLWGLVLDSAYIPPIDQFAVVVCFSLGNLVGVVGSSRTNRHRRSEFEAGSEIARQKEDLKALVCQRELLIRETNHRVKNNLMAIDSLLNLQASAAADPAVRSRLDESRARIQSMKLIHEKLYQATDLASIPLAVFLRGLIGAVFEVYRTNSIGIELVDEMEDILTDPAIATACGMIINELTTNSLKHAFQGSRSGRISIRLRSDGKNCALSFHDDGIGLPPDFDSRKCSSMGMQIVACYVDQLGGTLTVERNPGAGFHIVFPLPAS